MTRGGRGQGWGFRDPRGERPAGGAEDLGAVLLGIVTVRALRGQYSPGQHVSVSTASMYWHFVDIVWIFLVVVLYVGAEVGG